MSEIAVLEQSARINELQQELSSVQIERDSNKAAAEILTQMIASGEAQQDESGAVHLSKRKTEIPDVMGNEDDF